MDELWQSAAVQAAAADGDLGTVIRAARKARGWTQRQLGDACGYSQTAISRIERGEHQARDIKVLARLGRQLNIPARLLGLAEPQEPPVNRRHFLAATATTAAAAAIPGLHAPGEAGHAAGIRHVTSAYRQLDAVLPGRDLMGPVTAHLDLGRRLFGRAADDRHRGQLAEAVAETAGLAAWLAWDGANLGDARHYYQFAMKAARLSGNRLLGAYMSGSLAHLAIDYGDAAEGLALLRSARAQLGSAHNATSDAWLSCLEAVAHATAGQASHAAALLDRADAAAGRISVEEPPPWPWVFAFDCAKVAAHRMTCATRLRQPEAALVAARAAAPQLAGAHARQRALLALDLAEAHLLAGDAEQAFDCAHRALAELAPLSSARVADRARRFRRAAAGRVSPGIADGFDDRLRALAG